VQEAILKGIADDGGLYVPEYVPKVSPEFIGGLSRMGYAGAAAAVMGLFMDGFSDGEVAQCAADAYNGHKFDDAGIAPLRALGDGQTYVLELFHGPTGAFKDMALQFLPGVMSKCLGKTGAKGDTAILVATSGDTGKAALEGFRDVPQTRILVFYPENGVSEIQKLQMVTQEGGNVSVAAVKGNFDDAQTGVKAIFSDRAIAQRLGASGISLSSANSINWGRLMPQIAYYFWAYASLLGKGAIALGERVRFAVPTGNFGNILAGWYAKEMGLPISKLICASNVNNVLSDFIQTGVYDKNRGFSATMSPSMDILISSNLERLLFELSGKDAELVSGWMAGLSSRGRYDVGARMRDAVAETMCGGYATEIETAAAIRSVFGRHGYLMDTHTAVAMHVYMGMRGNGGGSAAIAGTGKSPEEGARKGENAGAGAASGGGDGAGKGMASGGGESAGNGMASGGGDGAGNGMAPGRDSEITVVVSTASPYKFAKDVYLAINPQDGADIGGHAGGASGSGGGASDSSGGGSASGTGGSGSADIDEFRYISLLEALSNSTAPKSLTELRAKRRRHFTVTAKDGMKDTALSLLLG
jgi:threonine synthase